MGSYNFAVFCDWEMILYHINYFCEKWAQDVCKGEAIYHCVDGRHDCRLNISEAIYRDCHLGVCLLFHTLSRGHLFFGSPATQ